MFVRNYILLAAVCLNFAPNGHGTNNIWVPKRNVAINLRHYPNFFNRTGGEVLSMNPIHEFCNGGMMPDGVYCWVLEDRNGLAVNMG